MRVKVHTPQPPPWRYILHHVGKNSLSFIHKATSRSPHSTSSDVHWKLSLSRERSYRRNWRFSSIHPWLKPKRELCQAKLTTRQRPVLEISIYPSPGSTQLPLYPEILPLQLFFCIPQLDFIFLVCSHRRPFLSNVRRKVTTTKLQLLLRDVSRLVLCL